MSSPEPGSEARPSLLTMWHPSKQAPSLLVSAPVHAWLAVTVAAAGGHHLSLTGPAGSGKTMLATALHYLLPDIPVAAAQYEHRQIHHHIGPTEMFAAPPWQQPHHTCSIASLTGRIGRDGYMKGTLALAHQGVLFIDDMPEFGKHHLGTIATVIHRCEIAISQGSATARTPVCAQLVMAARPCPCLNDRCECHPVSKGHYQRYTRRLRSLADLNIDLACTPEGLGSYDIEPGALSVLKERVAVARAHRLSRRFDPVLGLAVTAHARHATLRHRQWAIPDRATANLQRLVETGTIHHARACSIKAAAWTLADLAGRSTPTAGDVETALALHRPASLLA